MNAPRTPDSARFLPGRRRRGGRNGAAGLMLAVCLAAGGASAGTPVSFTRDIAPILQQKCSACHGPEKTKGGYQLHTFEQAQKPGGSKEAPFLAGSPAQSKLFQLITAKDADDRMPQKDDPLPATQIALIEQWIREGAKFDGPDSKALLTTFLQPTVQPDPPAIYPRPAPVLALAFSPDGRELAVGGYHEITVWNPADGLLLRRIRNVARQTQGLAYSPDGTLLAAASGTPGKTGEVKLFQAQGGELVKTLATLPDLALTVAFSPDGRRLASGGADNAIRVYEVTSGKPELVIEQHADWVMALAFSPDGAHLASASRDKSARYFDAQTGALQNSYLGHGEPVFSVAFSADGRQIFSAGRDRKIHGWEAAVQTASDKKKDAPKPLLLGGFDGDIMHIVFQDGQIFSVSADKQVRQQGVEKKSGPRTLGHHNDVPYSLALHAASQRLATGSYDGQVRLWNLADGEAAAMFTAAPGFQSAHK